MKVQLNMWNLVIIIHPLTWYLVPVACHNCDGDGANPIYKKQFWRLYDWWHTELSILCFTIDITK